MILLTLDPESLLEATLDPKVLLRQLMIAVGRLVQFHEMQQHYLPTVRFIHKRRSDCMMFCECEAVEIPDEVVVFGLGGV